MKTFLTFITLAAALALTACSTPQTRIAKEPELFSRLTPEQQNLIRQGQVGVGFDMDMVRLALGQPDRVRERIDKSGKSEIWSYLSYDGPDTVIVYRGWGRGGWGWGYPYYPSYLDARDRQGHPRERVVFRDGKVVSVEREKAG